jgi:hypothetical protein
VIRVLILEGGVDPTRKAAGTVITSPHEMPQGDISSALMLAIVRPVAVPLIDALLGASAERGYADIVDQPSDFFHTALHIAIQMGDAAVDTALALMRHKANPNAMNVDGGNALYKLMYAGTLNPGTDITRLLHALIDGGADPFQKTNMLFSQAFYHPAGLSLDGDNSLALAACAHASLGVTHGDHLSSDHATPSNLALTFSVCSTFYECLLQKGEAFLNNVAQLAAWDQAWDNLYLLLVAGVPPVSVNLISVLHTVAWSGNAQVLARLLQLPSCRALVNTLSTKGRTPLSLCCEGLASARPTMIRAEQQCFVDRLACTKILLEAGADSELGAVGYTPMVYAKVAARAVDISMSALAQAIVAYLRDEMGASEEVSELASDPARNIGPAERLALLT